MDYEQHNSSGTDDDDLSPPHQNRTSKSDCICGNGRPSVMWSQILSVWKPGEDMEPLVHHLEKMAYSSVLRAFKARTDAISREKESLMRKLRKELRLSNEEHRDLLSTVTADDFIRRLRFCLCEGIITKTHLRELRQSTGRASLARNGTVSNAPSVVSRPPVGWLGCSSQSQRKEAKGPSFRPQPGICGAAQASHDALPSPPVSSSSLPTQSSGRPSPVHPQAMGPRNQPSSLAAKSGREDSETQIFPPVPGESGDKRVASGGHANGKGRSLIGRKVRTRWPDDIFYEAVIGEYNRVEDEYAFAYAEGTQSETWDWVILSEIHPDDIKWVCEEEPGDNNARDYGKGLGKAAAAYFYDIIYTWLLPYLKGYEDVVADGNCGYRCVSHIVKLGNQSKWHEVRSDLLRELQENGLIYGNIYGFNELAKIINNVSWWNQEDEAEAPEINWMTLHDVGFAIANKYNAVVVGLSGKNSTTFLPTRFPEGVTAVAQEIWILCHAPTKHFISLTMSDDSPIPPICRLWGHHRADNVAHLEGLLEGRIQKWSFSVGLAPGVLFGDRRSTTNIEY
ncbi:hypothetical protein CASFOL_031259 [Castilleja foliolosa]|uniref:ENT domain-containing protein n=1 Tax=Castilleja foliolosa TaxID=1961234 RepID=A0ABD3C485_9LAMI